MSSSPRVEDVLAIAISAGQAILKIYSTEDFGTTLKNDKSPLTLADTASHDFIVRKLRSLTPKIPLLSEESEVCSYRDRKLWKRFWLIDPLDGTRDFIRLNGEFVVNIALIEDRRPILGVIHAPARNQSYFATSGNGAFKSVSSGRSQAIHVQETKKGNHKVIVSRSQSSNQVQRFLEPMGSYDSLSIGSALKFCLIAEGIAEFYPRLWPSMEWDTAAGQCIVEEAGGFVTDLRGNSLTYNKTELGSPFFISGAYRPEFWLNQVASSSIHY